MTIPAFLLGIHNASISPALPYTDRSAGFVSVPGSLGNCRRYLVRGRAIARCGSGTSADRTNGVEKSRTPKRNLSLGKARRPLPRSVCRSCKKQLDEAQQRVTSESDRVKSASGNSRRQLTEQLAELTASLPQHEAADQLVLTAAKVSARLDSLLMAAESQLQNQLAALRKSSVEWRSKASDAEQKIAAITRSTPGTGKEAERNQGGSGCCRR